MEHRYADMYRKDAGGWAEQRGHGGPRRRANARRRRVQQAGYLRAAARARGRCRSRAEARKYKDQAGSLSSRWRCRRNCRWSAVDRQC